MFHSIRWRIALPFALLILLLMVGLTAYLSSFIRQTYLDNLKTGQAGETRLAADQLGEELVSGASSDQLASIARRWASLLDMRVTILDPQGNIIAESEGDPNRMGNHLNRPEIQEALVNGEGSATRLSDSLDYEMLYTASVVRLDGETAGFVRLARSLDTIEASVDRLVYTMMAIAALATLVSIILAVWIANNTSRPLRQLTGAARQISSGNLDSRILPNTRDEVGQLTQAFNQMADRLRDQIEALEAERSKMAGVLTEMTDGVIIVDQLGAIQLINPAAQSMFGVSEVEARDRSLVEVARNHQLVELWRLSQRTGDTQVAPIEISAKGLYLQAVASPFGESLPASTLLIFQNLTRLRRLETVRRDFISNISHELRTPLASLKALTETLLEGALDDPPNARRFLQRMDTEVDAMSLMVSELLELSRIESGAIPLQMRPVSPNRLIESSVERLRVQAERAGLEIFLECPPDLPDTLVDESRMEQVMVILLHNAIKFTPAGGKIWVRARHSDNRVLISVQDTGIGIPREDLVRIFERFYKTDRARASGGTGLGLAIARHTVVAHGGKIWAESGDGDGSTFFLTLPIA